MKKFGTYFAELITATGLYGLLLWYFASNKYIFSSYNREISAVIVVLFGLGILMLVNHLWKLYREDRQLTNFFEQVENFRLTTHEIRATQTKLPPEMARTKLRKAFDEYFALFEPSLFRERLYKIFNMILAGNKPERETLAALLQQRLEIDGNRIRYIAGILIMVGLLGTFLGLVQAIKYLQHFFTASESVDMTTLFSDMKQTLGGLDQAFGTSIGGITAYIALGYLTIVLRSKQAYIQNRIEEATTEYILPILEPFYEDASPAGIEMQMLRTIPETLSHQLSLALDQVVRQTIGGSTQDLKATSALLQDAAQGMQAGQELFTNTLGAFGDFLTTFQEGRKQLVESQAALASGITEFSAELALLRENQGMLASSLSMTRDYMTNSETRFGSMDEVVHKIHDIWSDNRTTFEQVAETIQHEHQALATIAKSLEGFLEGAQQNFTSMVSDNTRVNRELLEAHTMLTTLLRDIKTFVLDEQQGLHVLSNSLQETFDETRFQYHQLAEHVVDVHKQLLDNQEQLAQFQGALETINQHMRT